MMALTLRYVEDHKEIAYQYAHALVSTLATTDDLQVSGALRLTRDIVTESTNDIRNFEGRRRRAGLTSHCSSLSTVSTPNWPTEPPVRQQH